jgi:hypothetical protein
MSVQKLPDLSEIAKSIRFPAALLRPGDAFRRAGNRCVCVAHDVRESDGQPFTTYDHYSSPGRDRITSNSPIEPALNDYGRWPDAFMLKLKQIAMASGLPLEPSREHVEAIKHLVKAAEDMLAMANDLMPGVKHIALQDYERLNLAPIAMREAINNAREVLS